MAKERQTTVNINYKVNYGEIDKSIELLKKANQSTDNLTKASQNFAQRSSAGYARTGTSISAMRTDLDRLKAQIESTSAADTKRLQQLSAQYKQLSSEIQKQTKLYLDQTKATKEASKSAQSLANSFGDVYSSMKLVISAGIAREIVDMTLNMAKLSGNLEGVKRAFDRLPASGLVMAELQKATHGTVTELELMQKALLAKNYQISLQALPRLLEFAAVRAQQTGQSVDYLVNSIVNGIGRKSLLILDNLQLSATEIKKELGGISLQAASVTQVSEAMGRIAERELRKMGGYADTTATQVERLETKWDKLRNTVSKALTSPAVLSFYDKVLTYFQAGVQTVTQGGNSVVQDQAKQQALVNVEAFKQMHITEKILEDKQKAYDIVQQEINTMVELIGRNNDVLKQMRERHTQLVTDDKFNSIKEDRELDNIIEQTKFYSFKNLTLKESINLLKQYLTTLEKVTTNEGGAGEDPRAQVTDSVRFFDINPKKKGPPMDSYASQIVDQIQEAMDRLKNTKVVLVPVQAQPTTFLTDWERALEENKEGIINASQNLVSAQVEAALMAEVNGYQARIDAARNYYDEQIALAGDNERARNELRIKEDREIQKLEKRRADREKKAATAGIVVSTALGIMKVFAGEGTFADKLIKSAIVAAEGLAQFTIANKARYYAKGELNIKGPGTKTSDSIPAFLSKGESVMTADETASSMGIFKAVRAKKLNDKVLKDIISGRSGGASFNDVNIVSRLAAIEKEIKSNRPPDFVKQGSEFYEVRKESETRTVRRRRKIMGY